MALQKVVRNMLSTGVSDSSDATAITIDSSERVGIGMSPNSGALNFAMDIQATTAGNAVRIKGRSAGGNEGWLVWTDNSNNPEAGIYATSDNLIFANTTSYTERMRIDSSGNVGIAQAAPASTLHIGDGASHFVRIENAASGDVSSGYQIYRGASTVGAQLYDNPQDDATTLLAAGQFNIITGGSGIDFHISSAGNVGIGQTSVGHKLTVNASAFDGIQLQSGGSDCGYLGVNTDTVYVGAGSNLIFHTGNAGLTNGTERMRIDSSGKLLIGTTSSAVNDTGIKLNENGTCVFTCNLTSENENIIINNNNSTGAVYKMDFRQNNATKGSIGCSGTAVSFNTSSDYRLKEVTGKAKGLDVINKLNPVAYNWKESGQADEGLIAQEVMEIVPNAVSGSEEDYYQMDYSKLVTPLVKAVQELYEQVDALQSEIKTLKGE
jgi:hypothetical protein